MDAQLAAVVGAVVIAAGGIVTGRWTSRAAQKASQETTMLGVMAHLRESEEAARADAKAAREEAEAARERANRIRDEADTEIAELRRDLAGIRGEMQGLRDLVASVRGELWRAEPDVGALRRIVGQPH